MTRQRRQIAAMLQVAFGRAYSHSPSRFFPGPRPRRSSTFVTAWFLTVFAIVGGGSLSGCVGTTSPTRAALESGVDVRAMDPSVRAQDDLFRHANGGWLSSAKIPADQHRWGAFDELRKRVDEQLHELVESLTRSNQPLSATETQVRDFYLAFMDVQHVEARGKGPIRNEWDSIGNITHRDQLIRYLGASQQKLFKVPLALYVAQDQKDSREQIVHSFQSGLGLPDREYYLGEDARFVAIRHAYVQYIETILRLAQLPQADSVAQRILSFETRLAQLQWPRSKNRDREARYNRYADLAALSGMAPRFDWFLWLDGAQIPKTGPFIVAQPDYVVGLTKLIDEIPLSTWREYLRLRLIDGAAPYLSDNFVQAHFAFHGQVILGLKEAQPRWRRAITTLSEQLADPLGQLYVARHFPGQARERMLDLVEHLKASYQQAIEDADWLSRSTRNEALGKLTKLNSKIGYPDNFRDFSSLYVRGDDLFGNMQRASRFAYRLNLQKLGQPADRAEWYVPPQVVNAFYSQTNNEIVFPAAFLQAPFFKFNAEDAANYGAIGAIIGHEISHGFDDQGRKSDGDGNLRNWWSEQDIAHFQRQSARLVQQYNALSPIKGLTVNGELTLGENLADLVGLTIAWRAWQNSLDRTTPPLIDGLTGAQRFFIAWAQAWRTQQREDSLRQQLVADAHAPAQFRCNAVVRNLDAFYDAFAVKPGDALYLAPAERVRIW